MSKSIPSSGAGAIRVMLKNKKDLHFEQQSKKANEERTSYLYDIFYENVTGTLNMSVVDGDIRIAALNLSMGKVVIFWSRMVNVSSSACGHRYRRYRYRGRN